MERFGKKQFTAMTLAMVFAFSLLASGCAQKQAQMDTSVADRAEAAAARAEKAAADAQMAAEKAERIFNQKMKK